MLLIYGNSFSILENGPSWEVTLQYRKWSNILMESHFPVQKMVHDGQSWSKRLFIYNKK
jgi:hypothetical protein